MDPDQRIILQIPNTILIRVAVGALHGKELRGPGRQTQALLHPGNRTSEMKVVFREIFFTLSNWFFLTI